MKQNVRFYQLCIKPSGFLVIVKMWISPSYPGNQLKQVKYIGKLSVNTKDKTIDLCLRDAHILIWAFIIFLLAGDGMVFNYLYARRVIIPFIDCEIPNGFVNSVN